MTIRSHAVERERERERENVNQQSTGNNKYLSISTHLSVSSMDLEWLCEVLTWLGITPLSFTPCLWSSESDNLLTLPSSAPLSLRPAPPVGDVLDLCECVANRDTPPPEWVGEVLGDVLRSGWSDKIDVWFKICAADPSVARVVWAVTKGGGGLCSWFGEVVCDSAGVVYSDELSEFSGSAEPELNLLIVLCITRRASKVDEKGSPSSSSLALVSCSKIVQRGWILKELSSDSLTDLSWALSVPCMMEASRPRSMWQGPHWMWGSDSATGDWIEWEIMENVLILWLSCNHKVNCIW